MKIRVDIPGIAVPLAIVASIFRHKQRGTRYVTLITAKAQSDIKEGDAVVVYLDAVTAQGHVREYQEFHDGRFQVEE